MNLILPSRGISALIRPLCASVTTRATERPIPNPPVPVIQGISYEPVAVGVIVDVPYDSMTEAVDLHPALHPVQEILSLPFIQEVLEFVSFENILIIHILPSFRKVSIWGEP